MKDRLEKILAYIKNNKLESAITLTALLLVLFTILNSKIESDIDQVNSDSVEFLILSNFDISRAAATGNLMQDTLSIGLSLNQSLSDTITSKEYLTMNNYRRQQTISANDSFSAYKAQKAKLDPLNKLHNLVKPICDVLAIFNALFAVFLIGKTSTKKHN